MSHQLGREFRFLYLWLKAIGFLKGAWDCLQREPSEMAQPALQLRSANGTKPSNVTRHEVPLGVGGRGAGQGAAWNVGFVLQGRPWKTGLM